jgi:hypothetical protein
MVLLALLAPRPMAIIALISHMAPLGLDAGDSTGSNGFGDCIGFCGFVALTAPTALALFIAHMAPMARALGALMGSMSLVVPMVSIAPTACMATMARWLWLDYPLYPL